jgi:SAM-dependent methyltransferase
VNFVRADVVDLSSQHDKTYDVVYTGGHVAVWVSDLRRYYREAARILKPGGPLIISEYHPFRRVWKDSPNSLELDFNYFDRGPHRFAAAPDVLYAAPGKLEQFEFHWTVADYISAILLQVVSLSTSRNLVIPARVGRVRPWPGFQPRFCWLAAEMASTSSRKTPHR